MKMTLTERWNGMRIYFYSYLKTNIDSLCESVGLNIHALLYSMIPQDS